MASEEIELLRQAGFSEDEILADAGFSNDEISGSSGASRGWSTNEEDEAEYDASPGWWDTGAKSMALGFARLGEGLGSAMESLEDDSFFGLDFQPGKYIKESARPYVEGTEEYLRDIPQDSWKKTFSDSVSGISSFLPTLPFAPGIKSMIGMGAANRFGQKKAELERAGAPDPESGAAVSAAIGVPIDAFQFFPAFNQALTPFRRTVESAVTGALGAGAETPASMYSDYVGGARPTEPSMDEVLEALPNTMTTGGITGGIVGAVQSARIEANDYFSNRAMQRKAGEWSAKIDELDSIKVQEQAAQEQVAQGLEPMQPEAKLIQDAAQADELPMPVTDPILAKEKILDQSGIDATDGLLQIDNSSEVFPEGVRKPFVDEPDRPQLTPDREAQIVSSEANIKDTQGVDSITGVKELNDGIAKKEVETVKKIDAEREKTKPEIPNPFKFTGFKDLVNRIRGKGFEDNPEVYTFFKSKKNLLAAEITKADKFPIYKRHHDAALKNFEMENSIAWDDAQNLRPFTLLNSKEKMNATALMYEANKRGAAFDASPQNLKRLGLSDREILGIQSVRKTLDTAAERLRAEGLKKIEESSVSTEAKQTQIDQLNQSINELLTTNYVPTGRYGKFGLTLYDKNGEVSEFIMNNSKGKLQNLLFKKLRQNPELDPLTSKVNPVAKALGSEYLGAHPDILDALGDSSGHIPSSSFLNRLKRRKSIEGFEWDLQRNIASYLSSQARYLSGQETRRNFTRLNKEFDAFMETLGNRDKTLYTGLRQNIKQLQDYVMTPSDSLNGMSKFFATYYLANNVKTTLVNTTSFLNAWANAARYMPYKGISAQPEIALAKSLGQTVKYYTKRLAGRTTGEVGKDLYASLEQARKEGVVGGNRVLKDFLQDASSPNANFSALGQKMSSQDAMFFLNQVSEDFVRTNTYILGWDIYDKAIPYFKKNGIEVPNRHEFAKRFVREVQADYTKAGIPDIAKNPVGKMGSTFRLWHHGFFRMLKNSVLEKNIGAVARFGGILGALGGVYATPLVGGVLKALKQAGYNPDKMIKDFTPWDDAENERATMYGLPTMEPANVNVAGAISPDILPRDALSGDPIAALGRAFLGVLADPVDRVSKANYFLNEKGDTGRALEQFLPRAFNIQDMVTAKRWRREGVRDSSGNPVLDRPVTEGEIFRKSLGFMPDTISRAYDRRQGLDRAKKDLGNENINRKIALKAFRNQDYSDLLEYAQKNNINVDPGEIRDMIKDMTSRDRYEQRKLGKKGRAKLEELNEEFPD